MRFRALMKWMAFRLVAADAPEEAGPGAVGVVSYKDRREALGGRRPGAKDGIRVLGEPRWGSAKHAVRAGDLSAAPWT
jgi:hypothetical protein